MAAQRRRRHAHGQCFSWRPPMADLWAPAYLARPPGGGKATVDATCRRLAWTPANRRDNNAAIHSPPIRGGPATSAVQLPPTTTGDLIHAHRRLYAFLS